MNLEESILIEENFTKLAVRDIIINKLNNFPCFYEYENKREMAAILWQRTEEKHENLAFLLTVINKHSELVKITNIYKLVNYIFVLIDAEKANKDFVVEVNPDDFI